VFLNSLLVFKKVEPYYNDDGEIARKSINMAVICLRTCNKDVQQDVLSMKETKKYGLREASK